MSDFNQEVVDYVSGFYQKHGIAPSINQIIKNVKKCSRNKLYDSFKGINDICTKAGIPSPTDRIEKTKNLTGNNRKSTSIIKLTGNDEIKLTKDQINRINTISHLEKGKSQSKVIDNLLDLDSLCRENKLDYTKIKAVSDHIEASKSNGLEPLKLLALELSMNKAGFTSLSDNNRKMLYDIAMYLQIRNLTIFEFIEIYNRYINIINITNAYSNNRIDLESFINRMKQI